MNPFKKRSGSLKSSFFQVAALAPEVEKDFPVASDIHPSAVIEVKSDELPEGDLLPPSVIAASSESGAKGRLSSKIYAGISWSLLSSFVNQVLNLLRSIMLVRLLSLGDFGIAGMAGTVLGALCVLTNIGVAASAFTTKFGSEEDRRRYVDTIWTIELVRGFSIGLLMSLAAYPTALFYHKPDLLPVVLLLAWVPFFGSLRNIGLSLTARDMQFGLLTFVGLAENIFAVGVSILLAWLMHSYWALVWAQLGAALFGLALSYLVHPYRPRLTFDRAAFLEGLNFGKHVFFISASGFIVTTLDNIVVGRVLGAVVLGTYLIAFSASSLLTNVVNQVMSAVFFPTFARIGREDKSKLGPASTRAFTVGAALLTVTTAFLIALAPEFLSVLYRHKGLGAVDPLRVLAVAGFFRALVALLSSILMGMNRPEIESRCKIIEGVVFIAAIIPLVTFFGMMGAAATGVLTFFVALLLRFWLAQKAFDGALKSLPPLLGISLLAIAGGYFVCDEALRLLPPFAPLLRLLICAPLTMLVSGAIFTLFRPQLVGEAKGLVANFR